MMRKRKLRRVAMARKVTSQSIIASNWPPPIWNRWSSSRGLSAIAVSARLWANSKLIERSQLSLFDCGYRLALLRVTYVHYNYKFRIDWLIDWQLVDAPDVGSGLCSSKCLLASLPKKQTGHESVYESSYSVYFYAMSQNVTILFSIDHSKNGHISTDVARHAVPLQ